MLFANRANGVIIGSIEVCATGAIVMKHGTNGATINTRWPMLWTSQVVAIIGVEAPAAMVFIDHIGEHTEEITWSTGYQYWYMPERYRNASRAHDIEAACSRTNSEDSLVESDEPTSVTTSVQTTAPVNQENVVEQPNQHHNQDSVVTVASGSGTGRLSRTPTHPTAALGDDTIENANRNIVHTTPMPDDIIWLDHMNEVPSNAHFTGSGRPFVHRNRQCTCTEGAW